MASKIGKVIDYDNFVGHIVDREDKYQFLDIDTVSKVKIGDIVIFSGEIQNDEKKAFFVEEINHYLSRTNNKDSKYLKFTKRG